MYPHPAPAIVTFGMPLIVLALAGAFVAAVRRAAVSRGAPAGEVRRRTMLATGGIALWMSAFAAAAGSGVLARFDARPPPLSLMMIAVVVGAIVFAFSQAGSDLVDHLPLGALIGFQAFRLPLELVMHEAARAGVMPAQMSFSGWNFDIVTGISASAVAPLVAWGRAPRALVVAWNALGAALLAIIAGIAMASMPLVRAFGGGAVNTFVAYVPFVFLPTVMVPFALVGHILVARWLLRHPAADIDEAARRKRRTKRRLVALASLVLLLALFLRTFSAAPLSPPAPLADALPPASPPAEMSVTQLPTGITHRSAAFAYRGGAFRDKRDFAMTAVLVKHPRGDVLIDTGFGRDVDAHFETMPFPFRAATSFERGRSAAEQLDAAGYDRRALRAILLTHAHWDHVSGVPDFPGTPVWITPEEHHYISEGGMVTALARRFTGVRYEDYGFEGGAYLGFAKSHDVYGDGAIVIVPSPGHTPGSVIVFLALPGGKRYALVGDLAWQREGITEREERPWLQRSLADADPSGVRDGLLRMAAIAARFPELTLVPAHEARGFADMPRLAIVAP